MKKIIHLPCRSGARFHLGKVARDRSIDLVDTSIWIHSDTLFAAIISQVARFAPDKIESVINSFKNEESIISSAYYYITPQNRETIYFLPAPIGVSNKCKDNYKVIRKIKFISRDIYNNGIKPQEWTSDKYPSIGSSFIISKVELDKIIPSDKLTIFRKVTNPKVQVRSDKDDGRLYNQTDIQLESDPDICRNNTIGFYFIFECKNTTVSEIITTAVELLADTGIGGKRSCGSGQFDTPYTKDYKNDFIKDNGSDRWMSLSLFHPKDNSEFNSAEYYRVIKRGGMPLGKDINLKLTNMIEEGAIFKSSESKGKLIDISLDEDNSRLRNGSSIFIPVPKNFCR